MLSCKDVSELLSESQEYRLTLRRRMIILMHLGMCSGCRNLKRQLEAMRKITRQYRHKGR